MKLKLYMDVYDGWNPEHASAMARVTWEKPVGGKRLSFVVEIPDYLLEPKVDVVVQETARAEEVK
jgi:hypothetical protein